MKQLGQPATFNSPLEAGMRAVALLGASFPQTYDLQRLVTFDFLLVHTGDVGGPDKPQAVTSAVPTAAADAFAQSVESILADWHFPEAGRVHFDPNTRDLVIAGKPRGARGKGLRAITHAAFTLGLLAHCRASRTPHPGFVILDSPLLSEITGVKVGEVVLDDGAACVHLHGKGRKQRSVPLWRSTVRAIRAWLRRNPKFDSDSPLLPNRKGQAMSRWNVMERLDRAVLVAAESCPDLATRQISPHVIRHTTAMHLLQAGVDISVIALWLGHESPATTHQYVEADLAMKERALARLQEPETKLRRYRAPDSLINFLRTL